MGEGGGGRREVGEGEGGGRREVGGEGVWGGGARFAVRVNALAIHVLTLFLFIYRELPTSSYGEN